MALYRPHGPHRPPGGDETPIAASGEHAAVDATPIAASGEHDAVDVASTADLATPRPKRRKRAPWHPGVQANGSFRDRVGRVFTEVDDEVIPVEARQMIEAGATLVWDRCGCGGGCGLMWVPPARLGELITTYPVLHRTRLGSGTMSAWKAKDGAALLLLQSAVTWGRVIR
jgi:hypothetical protein